MKNHSLVDERYGHMLAAYRKMIEPDKFQMNITRKVGIWTSKIYGFFGIQAEGFNRVGFYKVSTMHAWRL